MSKLLRFVILVVSVMIAIVIVGLAYFSNYESILENPSIYLILFLLFLNIIANIFQIIDFLEKHLSRKESVSEEKLDKRFYKTTRDLENLYSNPLQNPRPETSDEGKE